MSGRRRAGPRGRDGFSVIEIVVAMTLTAAVFAITFPFMQAQVRALGRGAGRTDADQVARYAVMMIDRDLRRASADSGQPLLVLAGPRAITFTADLVATDSTGPDAVDIDAGVSASQSTSWRLANAALLPLTTRSFPTQDYLDRQGVVSKRETISYWLKPDTVTGRTDLFVLWRRVNAGDSVVVVRSLVLPTDTAFFTYDRPDTATVGGVLTSTLQQIAAARLPLYWDSAAVDSIRSVTVRATGRFVDARTRQETQSTIRGTTMLTNAPGRILVACGAAPAAPTTNANPTLASGNGALFEIKVSWSASADDGKNAGANDVRGYVVEWTTNGGTTWRGLTTVSARRQAKYYWYHGLPITGTASSVTAQYRVKAIDCGGLASTPTTIGTVTF